MAQGLAATTSFSLGSPEASFDGRKKGRKEAGKERRIPKDGRRLITRPGSSPTLG